MATSSMQAVVERISIQRGLFYLPLDAQAFSVSRFLCKFVTHVGCSVDAPNFAEVERHAEAAVCVPQELQ